MLRIIFTILIGLTLAGMNAYAAGDLIVDDRIGINVEESELVQESEMRLVVKDDGYYTKIGTSYNATGMSTYDASNILNTFFGYYFLEGGYLQISSKSAITLYTNWLSGTKTAFHADTSGRVGIGTKTPGARFQVGNPEDGSVAVANEWTTFSDSSLKKNLTRIEDPLHKVSQINGYYYNWKEGDDTSKHAGVIAQEVEKVLPEIVSVDGNGLKAVNYGKITPLLIEAIKEQQKMIAELTDKVNDLEEEIKLKNSLVMIEADRQ